MTLKEKLHPKRFRCSPQFHAIIAYILGERGWTTPEICTLSITSDGFVVSMDNFIGSATDLEQNISGALDAANCTEKQKGHFWTLYKERVQDWRNYACCAH